MVAKRLNAAYALQDYEAAKLELTRLHRELMDLNPSAARSLEEGLEETLTVMVAGVIAGPAGTDWTFVTTPM